MWKLSAIYTEKGSFSEVGTSITEIVLCASSHLCLCLSGRERERDSCSGHEGGRESLAGMLACLLSPKAVHV